MARLNHTFSDSLLGNSGSNGPCFWLRWAVRDIFIDLVCLEVTYQPYAFTFEWWGRCFGHLHLVINLLILLAMGQFSPVNAPPSPESPFSFSDFWTRCVLSSWQRVLASAGHTTKMRGNQTAMGFSSSLWAPVCFWSLLLYLCLPLLIAFPGDFQFQPHIQKQWS